MPFFISSAGNDTALPSSTNSPYKSHHRLRNESLTQRIIVTTINKMQIEFDTDKRDKTMTERGLDFTRAGEVFAGVTVTIEDARQNYGEARFTTVGTLDGRSIVLVWTPRGEARRIISMRKANEREIAKYGPTLG